MVWLALPDVWFLMDADMVLFCFPFHSAPSDNMCGNYELEASAGEECDPGPTAVASGIDMCCSSECKLIGDAECR